MQVFLFLEVAGSGINGEDVMLGQTGAIECLHYEQAITSAGNRLEHEPIYFLKRIDSTSPLLHQALLQNSHIEATFAFLRSAPTTGESEHFYTVEISGGQLVSIRQTLPDRLDEETAVSPPIEEITLSYRQITWTHNIDYVSTSYTLNERHNPHRDG